MPRTTISTWRPLNVDPDLGDVGLVDEQVPLLADVRERVLGEPLELGAHGGARLVERRPRATRCSAGCPMAIVLAAADEHLVAVDRDDAALGDWRP